MIRRVLTIMLLAVSYAVPAAAQTSRETVSDQLKVISDTKADDGFAPDANAIGRASLLGVLEHDSTVYFEVMLETGREYHIAARCDDGCANIDTRVLNPDYSTLVEDMLDNDVPNMELKPAASGPHLLAVRMTSCAAQICYFGVIILSRTAR